VVILLGKLLRVLSQYVIINIIQEIITFPSTLSVDCRSTIQPAW